MLQIPVYTIRLKWRVRRYCEQVRATLRRHDLSQDPALMCIRKLDARPDGDRKVSVVDGWARHRGCEHTNAVVMVLCPWEAGQWEVVDGCSILVVLMLTFPERIDIDLRRTPAVLSHGRAMLRPTLRRH